MNTLLLTAVPLLADAAATPAGSKLGPAIILLAVALAFLLALRPALRHFRGSGGCCGGGGDPVPSSPAPAKTIGPVVARREIAIEGMHCMKCVARVQTALDALPGVAADVTLEPQRAAVRMDREVPDATLRAAVESQGFRVVSVTAA